MSSNDQRLKKISGGTDINNVPVQVERYGDRYLEYRKNYASAGKHNYLGDFPLYVAFEQTFKCNLRCHSCLQGYPEEKKKYDTGVSLMPRELFDWVVLECEQHNCPSVCMLNCEEPLLVKDIDERIKFVKDHGIMDVIMTTNGQLLTQDLANKICAAGLTHILLSIDAATPETYMKVRKNGDYDKVLNAISYINSWKKANSSSLPIIRASFVKTKNNYFEEELFIDRFKNIVDYIDVQSFFSVDGLNRELAPKGHGLVDPKTFVCAEPFRKVIVRSNGDVVPCCSVFAYKQVCGNVYENSIHEIFNGEKMKNLRQGLKEKKFNRICQDCLTNLYEPKK